MTDTLGSLVGSRPVPFLMRRGRRCRFLCDRGSASRRYLLQYHQMSGHFDFSPFIFTRPQRFTHGPSHRLTTRLFVLSYTKKKSAFGSLLAKLSYNHAQSWAFIKDSLFLLAFTSLSFCTYIPPYGSLSWSSCKPNVTEVYVTEKCFKKCVKSRSRFAAINSTRCA